MGTQVDFGSWHARRAADRPYMTEQGEVGRQDSPQHSLIHQPKSKKSDHKKKRSNRSAKYSEPGSHGVAASPSAESVGAGQRGFSLRQEDFLPTASPGPSIESGSKTVPHGKAARSSQEQIPRDVSADSAQSGSNPFVNLSHQLPPPGSRKHQTRQRQGRDTLPLSPVAATSSYGDQVRSCTLPLPRNGAPAENSNARSVMMTGTIKRGHKLQDTVEVQLHLTPHELEQMTRSVELDAMDKDDGSCGCGLRKGFHILVLSLIFIPFAFLSSLAMSFYIGTMCWYNLYTYLYEERTIWHRIFLCPLLIIFYPLLIIVFSFGIALVATIKQVSWCLSSWLKEINDFDKGFYGWLCNKLDVPECSPYEVVFLTEGQGHDDQEAGPSSDIIHRQAVPGAQVSQSAV